MKISKLKSFGLGSASAIALSVAASGAFADVVHLDDTIVDGSLCVGFDCVNGESFGFDTIRMKENNIRLHFQDTSNSASFPSADWRIVANDTSNGGAEYLGFEDSDFGRITFRVEHGAPVNALYVEADGDIGIKTANPVVDLHIVEGNTPTLRLEQDGSDGFTPQTWDVAGNESNFFVRDVTNGSRLSFRIRPSAPESSIDIQGDGDVGIGTSSPGTIASITDAAVHVRRTDGTASVKIEDTQAGAGFVYMLEMTSIATGGVAQRMTSGTTSIDFNNIGGEYRINFDDGDNQELELDAAGNMEIDGVLTQNSNRHSKTRIVAVDAEAILAKVEALPISAWTYKDDIDQGVRHIGPMAQDFYALFETGASETGISTMDTSGVALAAIKALSERNAELTARLEALEAQLAD